MFHSKENTVKGFHNYTLSFSTGPSEQKNVELKNEFPSKKSHYFSTLSKFWVNIVNSYLSRIFFFRRYVLFNPDYNNCVIIIIKQIIVFI